MTSSTRAETSEPSLRMRWILFGFLAASGVLALVDRQIISVLKPEMAAELGWTDDDYGTLGAWFQGATAVALLAAGPLVDKLGVKWANPIAVFSWSVAAMFHGMAHSLVQFTLCRIGLGATEAAVTPTAVKTIATIFPPNMRSTGVGLQNAIASFGAISAPFIITSFCWASLPPRSARDARPPLSGYTGSFVYVFWRFSSRSASRRSR